MFGTIQHHIIHRRIHSICPWVDLWLTIVHDLDHTAINIDSAQDLDVIIWKREAHYWMIPILIKRLFRIGAIMGGYNPIPDVLRLESANMLLRRPCISLYCCHWSSQSRHLLHTNTNTKVQVIIDMLIWQNHHLTYIRIIIHIGLCLAKSGCGYQWEIRQWELEQLGPF